MSLTHYNIPGWVATILALIGLSYKGFKIDSKVTSHDDSIRTHSKDLMKLRVAFPYLMQDKTEPVPMLMTEAGHHKACGEEQSKVCNKMEEVKREMRDGNAALVRRMDKMDQLREDSRKEQAARDTERAKIDLKIATTMGRVEEHLDKD